MTLTRRKTLALIGGGTILAAGAGYAGFAATRTPATALEPWDKAGQYADPRMNALSFALLAPNPHNLQPWQVRLEGEDSLSLFHDPSRRLPETDPFDRQIVIGLGCFLEQMTLAASVTGHRVTLKLYPEGTDGPVAHARFDKGASADPLAAHILDRRSCKEPFSDRAVPEEMARQLGEIAEIHTDPALVAKLRTLTFDAWLTETMTPHTMRESVDLMRMGKREINATPDGIDMGGLLMETLILTGVLSREALSDPESAGFKQGIEIYRKMLAATPAYAVLTSPTNTREDQIEAGRRWLRLNLRATALDLSLHPVSQALQEYPEMTPHYQAAHALLAPQGDTVQMLGRLGYGPATPRTPRWPLEAKLTHA